MECRIVPISEVPHYVHKISIYREVIETAMRLQPDQALEYKLDALGVKPDKFRAGVYNAARAMRIYSVISVKTSESRAWVFKQKSQMPIEHLAVPLNSNTKE